MGAVAVLAGAFLLLAGGLLLVFFVSQSTKADRASNWSFLAFYLLMAFVPVWTHRNYVGGRNMDIVWIAVMWILAALTVVALAIMFVATLLVVLGRVEYSRVATLTTLSFIPVLVWVAAVSVVIVLHGDFPAALGWLGIGVTSGALLAIALTAADTELLEGERVPGAGLQIIYGVAFLALATWIGWLGLA